MTAEQTTVLSELIAHTFEEAWNSVYPDNALLLLESEATDLGMQVLSALTDAGYSIVAPT